MLRVPRFDLTAKKQICFKSFVMQIIILVNINGREQWTDEITVQHSLLTDMSASCTVF